MRIFALVFALGLLIGGSKRDGAASRGRDAVSETDSADLRFAVELSERASDRALSDIRAFNALACALLGPLLAIAAVLDYGDIRSVIPLALTALGGGCAFTVLHYGDGLPIPSAGSMPCGTASTDAAAALRNLIADLRDWGGINDSIRETKRRAVVWTARFTLAAILATVIVKGVESGTIMRHNAPKMEDSPATSSAEKNGRKERSEANRVDVRERASFVYDPKTHKPLTDEDLKRYREWLARPWWRSWGRP